MTFERRIPVIFDNFTQILDLLEFPDENTFYFLQILQRKKENPELGNNSRVIKHYYVDNKKYLLEHKEEIVKLCRTFNARASINLNPRDREKAAFMTIQKIANQMMNKDYHNVPHAYSSICGIYVGSDIDKRWLIDIDTKDREVVRKIIAKVTELQELVLNKDYKVLSLIETLNGFHVITNPFNVDAFITEFKTIDIHKNNPTLLYYESNH